MPLRQRDSRELCRVDHEVERGDAPVRHGDADHGERTAGTADDPQRALLLGSIVVLASAGTALGATNTRGETKAATIEAEPQASRAA
jgi:hypothetical protein